MSCALTDVTEADPLPRGRVLGAEFFGRGADEVGADLVGKVLWRRGFGGGRLSEVEAYLPEDDPACHGARGRTGRNAAMFGPAGCLYVFLSYGVHTLVNIVCEPEGVGAAVLIRSCEPMGDASLGLGVAGLRGPGLVGRGLGIRLDMSGLALGEESGVFVLDDGERPEVGRTARVGISRGAGLLLRYYLIGSRYVSGPARMIGGEGR